MTEEAAQPRRATLLCAAIQGINGGLGWSLVPPLMPVMAADLGVSHTMGGLVWGATALGIALAAPLGGLAVDRFGPRRVVGCAVLVGACACAARAVAQGPWSLAAAMLVFGLHLGVVVPAIPKTLGAHVPARDLGRANGTALLAYTIGTALTVLTARTVLLPFFGGWRMLMVAAAVAMAWVAVVFILIMEDRSVFTGRVSARQALRLSRDPQLLRVAVMHFLLFGAYLALLGLLPRLLSEGGLSAGLVASWVAGWLAALGAANFGGAWLSDLVGRRRPVLLGGAALAGVALGLLALLPTGAGLWLLPVAAIGGGCVAPLLLVLPVELPSVGLGRAGGALGLLLVVGQVGGFVFPVVSGSLTEAGGSGLALGALALAHLLILIPARGLCETGRVARRQNATAASPCGMMMRST